MNARFAMLGAAGILGGEALGVYKDTTWVNAGAKGYDVPILPLIAIQAIVMGFLETKRYVHVATTPQSKHLASPLPPLYFRSMKLGDQEERERGRQMTEKED